MPSTVAVAAAAGLALLAYNHDDFYRTVANTVSALTITIYVVLAIWNVAIGFIAVVLRKSVASDRPRLEALERLEQRMILPLLPTTVVCYGLMAYVWLLTLLPQPK
jgi:hypothetical protein